MFSDCLWVGGEGGMEAAIAERLNIPFRTIPAAGVHGVGLRKLPGNIIKLLKGYLASREILKSFNPHALLFTGGYIAIPMALAAKNYKKVLYIPDIEPGLALKVLSRFADRIAVTNESSRRFFKKQEKITVTGYPIREDLKQWSKEKGLAYFNFCKEKPVLLFMGGSSGAHSINQALLKYLPNLLQNYQVIHLTGHLDWDQIKKQSESYNANYQAFPYLHEMGAALAAADLVISRAGASILGEYPYFGLPAILIPYPYAWRYQKVNADYLVEHGAALLIEDHMIDQELIPGIESIMNNKDIYKKMHLSMKALSKPDAAYSIALMVEQMAEVV